MAELIKPSDINKIWSSGGVNISPDNVKIINGWTIEEPPYQYYNWLDNKQDQAIAYNNQHGVNLWDGGTEYVAFKSYVQSNSGSLYLAIVTNTNVDPSDTGSWRKILDANGSISYSNTTTYSRSFLTSNNAAEARTNLGAGSVGASLFTASNIATARSLLGSGAVGDGLFTSTTQGNAQTVIGVIPASDAEAAAGVENTHFLKPNQLRLGFSANLSYPNGYIALPSWLLGIVFQWGKVNINADSTGTWVYPTPFPTKVLAVQATLSKKVTDTTNPTWDTNDDAGCSISNETSSSARVRNGVVEAMTINCFAIGH